MRLYEVNVGRVYSLLHFPQVAKNYKLINAALKIHIVFNSKADTGIR